MGREHLASRDNWQAKANAKGQSPEDIFSALMQLYFKETDYEGINKPKDLKGIYGLRPKTNKPHGIEPEYCIQNKKTGKKIYVEIKRQKKEGNAHERACKYFMPGVLLSMQAKCNLAAGVAPIWIIFCNGIAQDPARQQEISHWFKGYEPHLFLWQKISESDALIDHFETHIQPLLE